MSRPLIATIKNVTGTPREGLQVVFRPQVEGYEAVREVTDAAGVFRAELETGIPYALGLIGVLLLDGQELSEVTVIWVTVPEGEGPATLAEAEVQRLSTGWPVLLLRLQACETAAGGIPALAATLDALTARVTALEGP